MARTILRGVAATWLGLATVCAPPQVPTVAELLALDGVRMPSDPGYLALLAPAQRAGAAIATERMIALRRAWRASPDFDPVMPTVFARHVQPRDGNDCARAKPAADVILAIHWLDLRAHAVKPACARRGGDMAVAALHQAVRDATTGAVHSTGKGDEPERAASVISVDEEYAVFDVLGWRPVRVKYVEYFAGR